VSTPGEPVLRLAGVTRRYAALVAVDRADLALGEGRIACLLGPSGSGKSSLLRMIAGLEPVDEGMIHVAGACLSAPGRTVPPEQRGVGLVFQDNALFPHLDIAGNVAFGIAHLSAAERRERVARLLEQFHVAHLASAFPHMLSGGEQQRVAIARAMARSPALLLLDEPFSGLDGELRSRVREALLADLRRSGATVLIVTHDPAEAMLIADDLLLMAGGRILQSGAPADCYNHPVSLAAARLLGETFGLPGRVGEGAITTPLGAFPAQGMPDGEGMLLLRPHHLRLSREGTPARVESVRFAGGVWQVAVLVGALRLTVPVHGAPRQAGATVHVAVDTGGLCILAGDGEPRAI
jgi:iron(III) transport system ATP-binding protein